MLSAIRGATLLLGLATSMPFISAEPLTEGEPHEYTLWHRNFDNPAIQALVELALEKTPEYGDFSLARSEPLSQGRALQELATNGSTLLDIANVATTPFRKESLNAIPIPVDAGLLGFRVCLVLPENQPLFEGIRSAEDLKAKDIRIGQGAHWPDSAVLASSGIEVVTHTRFELLFRMLRNERFECFARGVNEVLYDQENIEAQGLVIEHSLLLAYPMPSYLFTAPDDEETAQRLQLGLERAIKDGSFASYLRQFYGRAIKELDLKQRTMITFENPNLTEESRRVGREALENLDQRIKLLQDR